MLTQRVEQSGWYIGRDAQEGMEEEEGEGLFVDDLVDIKAVAVTGRSVV